PYCNIADNKCYSDDNGRWSVAGFRLQPDFQTASIRSNIGMSLNLQMSDQPADSAMFVGAYGYGLSGDDVFGYADATLYQILYDTVLFPVPPSQFHGAIPPALSANASVLERVGFLQTGMVPPSQVDANWDNRNRLLPVVTALARTLGKKTNPASAYGAFQLLGNVADAVARPYIYRGMDPESGVSGLIQYHLEGSGPSFNIRSPALTISDYGPDSNLRSLVSLLIESTRRYQDGILTLVSKTRLIEKAVQLLAATGQASVTTARNQFYDYLASFLSQENPDAILSSSTLIDLRLEAGDLADFLGQYSVGKDPAYDHDDWVHVQTSVELFGDWFGSSSPRSLVNGLDRAIQIFSQIPPTATETSAIFDSLLSVVENSGNPAVELQRMIQVQLPGLLTSMKSDFYYLSGAMAGLSVDGGFFKFIHSNIFNTHALGEIYMDTERFLQSPAMQDRGDSPHSLIYAAGSLMHYFSKIRDQGTRINGPAGYWFEDHMSRGADQDPPYEWLKVLLSNK
ncbi:MAG: hypothetical protein KDK33_07805, partial [Leptospiraceae bacterium]|nr:hypothetical protein [Leptospiraceae bacterium]